MAAPPVLLMGILNVTPDSFSDGGLHTDAAAAGRRLLADGADILDIGGESTRPGADPVPPEEEQRRILPIVRLLVREGARISVDTRHASTMQAVLDAGATMINDVSALHHDPCSPGTLARYDCQVILMHMRGIPKTMQLHASYSDVVAEVAAELAASVARAEAAGIARSRIIVDPGLGFAKTAAHSLAVLRGVRTLGAALDDLPIMIGASRKGFIATFGEEPEPRRRAPGSIAAALFAAMNGASILRVHDVAETRQALLVWQALHA